LLLTIAPSAECLDEQCSLRSRGGQQVSAGIEGIAELITGNIEDSEELTNPALLPAKASDITNYPRFTGILKGGGFNDRSVQ
jgi:hypothetical protein